MTTRVAHVSCDPGVRGGRSKGAAVHLEALRRAFAGLGAEVHAIDARTDGEARERLGELLESGSLDLVYERFALHGNAVSALCSERAIPHVLEINAPLDDEAKRHRPEDVIALDREAQRQTLAKATLTLSVSDYIRDWSVARGAAPERAVVEPNAIDPEHFSPRLRAAGRELLGLGADALVVGFHGRLRPWHRFDAIARAVRGLRQRGVEAQLLALGRGDYAEILERELGPAGWRHIEWLPHEQIGPIVASFDALPLAYAPDEPCYFSPLKLREAMASGVVPVVPTLGDLEREVDGGRAGVLYDPSEAQGLEQALASVLDGADASARRVALGRQAAERAAGHTWASIAERVLERVLRTPVLPARRSE